MSFDTIVIPGLVPGIQGDMRRACNFLSLHDTNSVMPAKAGISGHGRMSLRHETPASAGVTRQMAMMRRAVLDKRENEQWQC